MDHTIRSLSTIFPQLNLLKKRKRRSADTKKYEMLDFGGGFEDTYVFTDDEDRQSALPEVTSNNKQHETTFEETKSESDEKFVIIQKIASKTFKVRRRSKAKTEADFEYVSIPK